MSKIIVIADVHSNLVALEKVMEKAKGTGMIIAAGDLVGYNARPNECVSLLRKLKLRSALGDHDHACVSGETTGMNPIGVQTAEWTRKRLTAASKSYLKGLPQKLEIEADGKKIVVLHGSPSEILCGCVFPWLPDSVFEGFLEDTKADILILGHTHVPFVKKLEGGLVLNPGSIGQPRDHNRQASHAVIDLKKMDASIIRTEYDIPKVSDEIVDAGLPTFLAERLYSGM